MELHLKIIGYLLIALALIHIAFPKYFRWKEDLKNLTTMNRQMMYVHSFFIALVVLLMGILCLVFSNDLIETKLGNNLALGLFFFWSVRLFVQLFVYSTQLWRGKIFETTIHILFSILWGYQSVIFFLVYWNSKNLSA